MKSIAIWYEPRLSSEILLDDIELHFNLWKLPDNRSNYLRFIDIGVKLGSMESVGELKIYFPCKLNKDDFKDIVGHFIHKSDLVSAIFNENYKTTASSTSKSYRITDGNDKFVFNIYKTSQEDIVFERNFSGTIVKIKCPDINETTYFRFRVSGDFLDSLSVIQKTANSFFQSAFSQTELIDFRVNEARDLDLSLLEAMNNEKTLKISKVHFFFVCSSGEDVLGYHQPYNSCRNLENYRWGDYVGNQTFKQSQIFLAYHWKDKDIEDYSILIKTKFERNNWKTIVTYLLALFLITVLFSVFSSWLFEKIK